MKISTKFIAGASYISTECFHQSTFQPKTKTSFAVGGSPWILSQKDLGSLRYFSLHLAA